MKTLKLTFLMLQAVVITGLIFSSCVRGKGSVVTQTVQIDPFSGIDNRISADVYIKQASVQSVEISAQQNIIDHIKLTVNDGIWSIKFDKNNVGHFEPINIYISIPTLSSLDVSGSGNVYMENTFDSCGRVDMNVSGSGNIDAYLNSASKVYASISGSGNINLNGSSPDQDISISGSGNVHAFPFHTQQTVVSISGSGMCEVTADSTLNVSISGSGDVYYKSHPGITSNISGSGGIHDAN
jgi:hypothetical protein